MVAESIIWFLIALLLMGFFAGMEMVFYSADRSISRDRQKRSADRLFSDFFERPDRFMATTLLGFTFFLVVLSLQSSNVTQLIWTRFKVGSDTARVLVEIAGVTLIVLGLAEFMPRAIFSAQGKRLLPFTGPIFVVLFKLFEPIAAALMRWSQWVLVYVFSIRVHPHKEALRSTEPDWLISASAHDVRKERQTQLMENAQELPKVRIRQCLVPRKEIVGISIDASIEKLKQQFIDTKLSRLPVYDKNIDRIVGYVHQLDLFGAPTSISEIMYPIPAVPQSMSAANLIGKLTREQKSMAWVVDEFGGTAGIITLEDVLEEIFGEIQDEYDTEELLEKKITDDDFIFSGRIELDYLDQKYGLDLRHEEAETLSGYVIHHHEKIPRQKERIVIDGFTFEILQVSDTRIETIRVKRLR